MSTHGQEVILPVWTTLNSEKATWGGSELSMATKVRFAPGLWRGGGVRGRRREGASSWRSDEMGQT